MNRFQRYIFREALNMLLLLLGGLVGVALLTQGLAQIDVIVDSRQSALTFLKVTALATPLVVAITLPIAVFIACVVALNRVHADNEIVVAQSAGMTRWQAAAPVLRLAAFAAVVHLIVGLWVQPSAYREMRAVLGDAQSDLATLLVREGAFSSPVDGITLYVRETGRNGELSGLLFNDSRNPAQRVTYVAQSGRIFEFEGAPALLMRNGQGQQLTDTGSLSILDFDEYLLDLTPFMAEPDALRLKASDRYLFELFGPDLTSYWDHQNQESFLAEGHARLAGPLMNFAMAMIALIAVIGGDFSRRGYGRRIAIAAACAVVLRLFGLVAQSAAADDPSLNVLQYAAPVAVFVILTVIYLKPGRRTAKRRFTGAFAAISGRGA